MGAQQSVPAPTVPGPATSGTSGSAAPVDISNKACPLGYGKDAVPQEKKQSDSNKAECPLGYDKKPSANEDKKECTSCKTQDSSVAAVPTESVCPVKRKNGPPQTTVTSSAPECPVKTKDGAYKNPNVYNVYNQKIDPTNQMPTIANQQPAPNQAVALPTERESSSIPKGGTESTWVYPSPQMFWNALVRKDKTEGVIEEDILSVVRIHNNMNEATWQQVLEWEKLHPVEGQGREPKLLRFLGRPDELSPKARLKALFGHTEPFDRHDWIVDRGGEEVRYVIDYYHDEAGAPQDKTPQTMRDFHAIKSIKTDVRPALDSVGSVVDRVFKMPFYQLSGKTEYRDLPFFPEKKTVAAEVMQIEKIKQTWQTIRNECEQEKDKLMTCQSEKDCENASISLQRCTAGVVCPKIAADFDRSIQAQPFDAEKTDRVYTSMVKCLELFEIDSKKAFQQVNKK